MIVDVVAQHDITKYDFVYNMPVREFFNHLSFRKWRLAKEAREQAKLRGDKVRSV